jgi:hypothetical protein
MADIRTIVVPVTAGASAMTWQIPLGVSLFIESVYIHWDGSLATGPVQPFLLINDVSGVHLARVVQSGSVPAGTDGNATWALRLSGDGAGAVAGGVGWLPTGQISYQVPASSPWGNAVEQEFQMAGNFTIGGGVSFVDQGGGVFWVHVDSPPVPTVAWIACGIKLHVNANGDRYMQVEQSEDGGATWFPIVRAGATTNAEGEWCTNATVRTLFTIPALFRSLLYQDTGNPNEYCDPEGTYINIALAPVTAVP